MNENSTSLFHFTKQQYVFKKILSQGLRYSYSPEYRPENIVSPNSVYANSKILVPLISFCDIPLVINQKHRKKYGDYGLGLDKSFLRNRLKETFNMVNYFSSPALIQTLCNQWEVSERDINNGLNEIREDPIKAMFQNEFVDSCMRQKYLAFLLTFFKPHDDNSYTYYDEKEWRAVLKESKEHDCRWSMNISDESYENEKSEHITISREIANRCNNAIGDNPYFYLQLTENEIFEGITHILLPNETEAEEFASLIFKSSCLFGTEMPSEKCKLNLIRKINSFERIEKDYRL